MSDIVYTEVGSSWCGCDGPDRWCEVCKGRLPTGAAHKEACRVIVEHKFNARAIGSFEWNTDPPSGVCWARHAVYDTQGCVVVEAEKPSEGEPRWVQFADWGATLPDCIGSGWEFAPIPKATP